MYFGSEFLKGSLICVNKDDKNGIDSLQPFFAKLISEAENQNVQRLFSIEQQNLYPVSTVETPRGFITSYADYSDATASKYLDDWRPPVVRKAYADVVPLVSNAYKFNRERLLRGGYDYFGLLEPQRRSQLEVPDEAYYYAVAKTLARNFNQVSNSLAANCLTTSSEALSEILAKVAAGELPSWNRSKDQLAMKSIMTKGLGCGTCLSREAVHASSPRVRPYSFMYAPGIENGIPTHEDFKTKDIVLFTGCDSSSP